jgi:hypothetical protein
MIRQGVYRKPWARGVWNGSKCDLTGPKRHFRSSPINGHSQAGHAGPVRAISGQASAEPRLLRRPSLS